MNHKIALLSLAACAALGVPSSLLALSEENINKKLPASPGGKLVVEVEFGSIEVTGGEGSEVTLTAMRRINFSSDEKEKEYVDSVPITFTAEGNTIKVRARRDRGKSGWNWGWGWGKSKTEARYTLTVPRSFNVQLDTSGGPISVTDLKGETRADTSGGSLKFTKLRGPIHGDTSGGSITATECEGEIKIDTSGGHIEVSSSKGTLKADTSGGRIAVRNFAGDATVSTSGGGLALENVAGVLRGETSGGSIKATVLAPLPGEVRLETSGGSIELTAPAGAAFALDAATSVGRVTSDFPVTSVSNRSADRERDTLRGDVNGGGKTIKLRTSAGSIRIKQA